MVLKAERTQRDAPFELQKHNTSLAQLSKWELSWKLHSSGVSGWPALPHLKTAMFNAFVVTSRPAHLKLQGK